MTIKPTKQQVDIIEAAKKEKALKIVAGAGAAKEQPVSSIIRTPKGNKLMGDIKVGDYVFNRYGKPTQVVGVYPQGVKPVYEVTFRDGSKVRCGLEHNWAVTTNTMRDQNSTKVMTLEEIIKFGLFKKDGGYKVKVPMCDPVDYETKNLPIPPYVLGAWLGDGSLTSSTPILSYHKEDYFIVNKVLNQLSEHFGVDFVGNPRETSENGMQTTLSTVIKSQNKNSNLLTKQLRILNLNSNNKYIPDIYLQADVHQRLELLRGLMDTDGSVYKNRVSFSNTNKAIIFAIKELVTSLGGTCIERKSVLASETRKSTVYYLNVKLMMNPFSLPRKMERWAPSKKNPPSRYITEIKDLGFCEEQQCIMVSSEDHTYLTESYVVTHNTTTMHMIGESQDVPCLYLAYNKAMAVEANGKFPVNVECRSTHSLAYKYEGRNIAHKLNRPEGAYVNVAGTPTEISHYYKVQPIQVDEDTYINSVYLSSIAKDTVAKFEQSDRKNLCKKSIPWDTEEEITRRYGAKYVGKVNSSVMKIANKLWKDRIDPENIVLATHDTYLKLFELSDVKIEDYEIVFLDEAQDANNCTISILNKKFPKSKVFVVGDDFQQIYQFRGSVNALSRMRGKQFVLSKSFRFGKEIAKIATKVLEGKFVLEGNEKVKSKVGKNILSLNEKRTEIFRTNSCLVERGIQLLEKGVSVFIDYDTKDFLSKINSTQALFEGDMKKVKHVSIVPFNTFDEMLNEAEHDNDLKRLVNIVRNGDTDYYVKALTSYKKPRTYNVHLITAHRSKGLEFDNVALADDFPSIYDKNGAYVGLHEFEQNLLYVALTRAKLKLQYNSTVDEILKLGEKNNSQDLKVDSVKVNEFNPSFGYDPVMERIMNDAVEDENGEISVRTMPDLNNDISFYLSALNIR